MRDNPIKADGGPNDRLDRITEIAENLEDLGGSIQTAATSETLAIETDLGSADSEAPAPDEFATEQAYLEEAQAWVTDELQAAGSDLEHRTLELQQALDMYPGIDDDRPEADTRREVVVDDMAAVAGAMERLLRAGTQLARLEETQTDS